jgi:hypothetical protein
MLSNTRADLEPAWAKRLWYGSVFGAWCIAGAGGVVLSFIKSGTFRFFVGACYLTVFAIALHCLLIGMGTDPPTKKLSVCMVFVTFLGLLPWLLRPFLQ